MKKESNRPNIQAFQGLYREYYHDIFRFLYSLTGDGEEAADLAQETFIKLYHQMDSGPEIEKPRAWVYRVAANTGYNHLRRKKTFREIVAGKNLPEDTVPDHAASNLVKEQEIQALRAAMAQLPARDRVILTLYKNGLKTPEIARALQVKTGSVGKTLARSVAKLSKIINQGEVR